MSVDIHLDRTVSTAEPFVAKLVMVMHYRGPECHAKKKNFFFFFAICKVKVTMRALMIKYDCFYRVC